VSGNDIQSLKKALTDAGVEIYRTEPDVLHVAERIRLHIMDSGIRVRLTMDGPVVAFAVRSQRSDFPRDTPEDLFSRVRSAVESGVLPRGYAEARTETVEVKDPVDDSKILDVWHEIIFEKTVPAVDALVDEVKWALSVEKYVTR